MRDNTEAIPSDQELLGRMRDGNEAAFVELYHRRQAGVYRFALEMSGSTVIAEEVTQEVFMWLIRRPEQYDPSRGTVASYLYGVARNYTLRLLERDRAWLPLAEDESDAAIHAVDDPAAEVIRADAVEKVRRAVLWLPPAYREVVVLCDLHEMTYEQAAKALGCAVGTVRSRLHRGRALLAAKLSALLASPAQSERSCV